MEKKFIIYVDSVTGTVRWENPDDLNFFEVFGALGCVQADATNAYQEDE